MNEIKDDMDREIILDHYGHPRRWKALDDGAAVLTNPSCGDRIRLSLDRKDDGKTVDIRFDGKGCSISMASASMMADLLSGKDERTAIETAEAVLRAFRGETPPESLEAFGDVAALAGVASLPVRVKCATLAWQGALRLLRKP